MARVRSNWVSSLLCCSCVTHLCIAGGWCRSVFVVFGSHHCHPHAVWSSCNSVVLLDMVPFTWKTTFQTFVSHQDHGSQGAWCKRYVSCSTLFSCTLADSSWQRISVLAGYVLFTVLVELSERLQLVNGKSAQTAGIDLLPFLGSAAVGEYAPSVPYRSSASPC